MTTQDQGSGTNYSQATDPGPSFIDGVTPTFTVAPGRVSTRAATAADGVSARYVDIDVDAGMFVTGSAAALVPTAPAEDLAAAGLADTGTAIESAGWTDPSLLLTGVAVGVGTTRRRRRVEVTA